MDNKVLPQNLEAEEAILGGILLDPFAIERVQELLDASHFAIPAHQTIYRTALNLYLQGKPTDLMTVCTVLSDREQLEKVGGQVKLAQLVDRTVSAVNVDQYAFLVIEKALRRELIRVCQESIEMAFEVATPIEDILSETEEKIFKVTQFNIKSSDLVPVGEILIDTFEEIEQRHEGNILPGLTCNFYDLDTMTGGFQRSDLITLAGRPGMGKTAMVNTIAYNIAKIHGLPVAIFSMEMSKEQLVQRLLSADSKIETNRIRTGTISVNEWEPLTAAIGSISELKVFIDDSPNISVTEIGAKCRRLKAEQGELGMVILDYLQLMGSGESENRVQELSRITRGLKVLARELNVPIVMLSQLSRAVENRNNKRPQLSDLRDSGSVEQDSDIVIMLYRDEYYNPDSPDRGISEVIIAKHRNGPTGTIKLCFDSKFTEFKNLAGGDRYLSHSV